MNKLFSIALFLLSALNANAQKDTIFFDHKWNACSKADAAFFRPAAAKEGSLYRVKDFYISGVLQMSGTATSGDPAVQINEGRFTYYNANGKKSSEGNYVHGKKTGTWKNYYSRVEKIYTTFEYKEGKLDGAYTGFDTCGKIKGKGLYKNDEREGIWEYYLPCVGAKISEETFVAGKLNGRAVYYDSAGKIMREGNYKDGKEEGQWKYYEKNTSQLKVTVTYKEGKVEERVPPNATIPTDRNISGYIEQMPKCLVDISSYLAKNITYPKKARRNNTEGKVVVRFVVDEDGYVTHAEVISGIGSGCDEEALRVVSSMPKWEPGTQNGEPVKVYFTLPIMFKLQD